MVRPTSLKKVVLNFQSSQTDNSILPTLDQETSEQVKVQINTPGVNISFNAGHDYEMYVQYDDYGAVIQIEDVANLLRWIRTYHAGRRM